MRRFILTFCVCLLWMQKPLVGASLPGNLGSAELGRIVEVVGFSSAPKLLRSAESYAFFPGLKIGATMTLIPTKEINNLGDGAGSLPSTLFYPQIYLSKGLFWGLELTLNLFPNGIMSNFSSSGGFLKWSFMSEKESWAGLAAFIGYSKLSAFNTYSGNTMEAGVVASKDYVRLKPYIGAGILRTKGTFSSAIVSAPSLTASKTGMHLFLGMEWDILMNITAQLDMTNFSNLTGTLLISQVF